MNKIGSFLKSLGKGLLSEVPVVGSVINSMTVAKKESSDHSPSGSTDYAHLAGVLIFAFIVVALVFGWIDEETFKMINSKNNIRDIISD